MGRRLLEKSPRLEEICKKYQLTQHKFAEKLGRTDSSFLSAWWVEGKVDLKLVRAWMALTDPDFVADVEADVAAAAGGSVETAVPEARDHIEFYLALEDITDAFESERSQLCPIQGILFRTQHQLETYRGRFRSKLVSRALDTMTDLHETVLAAAQKAEQSSSSFLERISALGSTSSACAGLKSELKRNRVENQLREQVSSLRQAIEAFRVDFPGRCGDLAGDIALAVKSLAPGSLEPWEVEIEQLISGWDLGGLKATMEAASQNPGPKEFHTLLSQNLDYDQRMEYWELLTENRRMCLLVDLQIKMSWRPAGAETMVLIPDMF